MKTRRGALHTLLHDLLHGVEMSPAASKCDLHLVKPSECLGYAHGAAVGALVGTRVGMAHVGFIANKHLPRRHASLELVWPTGVRL